MKTVYTVEALSDIDGILNWLGHHYPTVAPAVSQRIEQVVARIAAWPGSARLFQAVQAFTRCRWVVIPT